MIDEEELKKTILETLRTILLSESTDGRLAPISIVLSFLEKESSDKAKEYVEKLKKLKERMTTYISPSVYLLRDIQELFPEFYDELIKIPEIAIYNAISKIKVKRYASGDILVIVPLPGVMPGNVYEFKFRDVSKVKEAIETKKYNKMLIERYEVIEILKAYGLKEEGLSEETITQLVIKFNKMLADYIISQYKKVLPFEDRNEELEFEKFKRFLAEWEHVFYWTDDRGEFFESAGIDPNFVILVKDNEVYIPTKLINEFMSTKRFSNILVKVFDYYAKIFKTSYMIFGKKYDIRYMILPISLLKTSLGITIEPKDPVEYLKKEGEKEELEKELDKLDNEDNNNL